jgi:hypothetical protein
MVKKSSIDGRSSILKPNKVKLKSSLDHRKKNAKPNKS